MTAALNANFAEELVAELAEANLGACLQCRKCTSGCPVAARADIKAHELVRLVQLGQWEEVLTSRMIWECTSCQTCATRCPQKVSVAALNDALRQASIARGKVASGNAVAVFNDTFLRFVRRMGRMYEVGLMATFKLRTWRLFEDAGKAPMMLRKGKLPLLPKSVGGRAERKAMFERVAKAGGKKR
jgi:heterodisulfide reductase subunit C